MLVKGLIEDARAAIRALRDVRDFGREARRKRAAGFNATWGNEGEVGGVEPTHRVVLDLRCEGLSIQGVVNSEKLDESGTFLGTTLFSGRRWGKRASGELFKFRRGRRESLGHLYLRLKGTELHFKVKKGVADFLPREGVTWKYPDGAA